MIEVFPSEETLAAAVADHVAAHAEKAVAAAGRFALVLAGGSTPAHAYALLGSGPVRDRIEWSRVHILWGDERCVPPDDPRSNYRMARQTLLDRVPVPAEQIHRIRGEDDPDRAAADYERTIRALPGALDLVLLGMGDDGHTASLFPGQPAVRETERWVVATAAAMGGVRRVTLTPGILNRAGQVTFVVSGAAKADRVREVLRGPRRPEALPAQAIQPGAGRLTWLLDRAAAEGLSPPGG